LTGAQRSRGGTPVGLQKEARQSCQEKVNPIQEEYDTNHAEAIVDYVEQRKVFI